MRDRPIVSIIMPAFNSGNFISESIESIKNQDFRLWELIVVDDCSKDNTVKIVSDLARHDERIKIIELELNSGAAVARNRAIKESKGRFIAFLDSDDQWKPNKLSKQIDFMKNNNYHLTYSSYDAVDKQGEYLKTITIPQKISYNQLLKTNYIGCLTAIYDTKTLGKVYMPLVRKRQDFGLWLKILKKVDYAHGLNESLSLYRVHDKSMTSNKIDAAKHTWYLYRKVEGLSVIKSSYYFLNYAVIGILRNL